MALTFEKLEVYRLSEKLADQVWTMVLKWNNLARDTVGKQLVRAADSVGANIAEGFGRGSFNDNRRFVRIARGSLNESRHWLRRAYQRQLLGDADVRSVKSLLEELAPRLNAYLNAIGPRPGRTSAPGAASVKGQRTRDKGHRTNSNA